MSSLFRSTVKLFLAAVFLPSMQVALHAQAVQATPNGVRVTGNNLTIELNALRDDVLRVREWQGAKIPEDSSWAVLPHSRASRVPVTATARGFRTKSLEVSIDEAMRITVRDSDGKVLQQQAEPVRYDDTNFRLYMKMTDDEHFFGLGDKPGPLDRRGMSFADWNTDIGYSESTDPIYKSIPFFYSWRSGHVLGVLFDNTWRASFDFGKEREHEYSFGSVNGPIDYYLMYGPDPKQVAGEYAWLTGTTPMPPKWTLGYQQSRFSYFPESRVMEIAKRLRDDKFPADGIDLDIDYQQNHRPFTVDRKQFPSFEQMIQQLKDEHIHVVAITDLHIAKLPDAGYKPYDEGEAQNRFVKMPDGKDFVGWVWPGDTVFPDYTVADTRAWWGTLYTDFVKDGIDGFWNDMNEPSVFNVANKTMPDDAQHAIRGDEDLGFKDRVTNHLEIHNVLGMLQTEGTYEGLRKLRPNERPFVLTRASYAGGQRYAATWTGDNSSTWNHLRLTTPMLENLGLSGFAMAGADVGGFRGSPQMDLLTKWFEIGAFQTIDRDHTTDTSRPQEPWEGGSAHEAIRRKYVETRYELMPYFYTTVKSMSQTGVPVVRPLFMEFPEDATDGHPIDLDAPAEFLFGPDLLVAPPEFPEETDDYAVVFPKGIWYDYWTGVRIDKQNPASKDVTITPTLEILPVYARGGSVIPEQPLVQSTDEKPNGPLTLRVYPDAANACSGALYDDDGKSYAFEHDGYLKMEATCTATAGGLTIHLSAHRGQFPAWWHEVQFEIYGLPKRPAAQFAGHNVTVEHAPTCDAWRVTVPDNGTGAEIQLTTGS
ncbi:TIM-barrel domain-containing protein [Silvibacterium acidisoli]|uniref:TIM-barrel domain-containing protein n=1 Tax=Acidobacteriaceae bacterium ZG23-2 TaxID=2883246 RepID=UPI00406C3BB2